MRSTSAAASGLSKQSGTHAHTLTHIHTYTHTQAGRQTTRAKQSSAGDGHLRCTDEFPARVSPVFTYSYVIIIILAHSGTPTHTHTLAQHVILRALLSTLRAEAEAKAEQRMCFIGTFCTIAAPLTPPNSHPANSLTVLNERATARQRGGDSAEVSCSPHKVRARCHRWASAASPHHRHHPHRARHCCALATACGAVPQLPLAPASPLPPLIAWLLY